MSVERDFLWVCEPILSVLWLCDGGDGGFIIFIGFVLLCEVDHHAAFIVMDDPRFT